MKHELPCPGQILMAAGAVPAAETPPGVEEGLLYFGVIFLAVGLVSVFYPKLFWYLRVGRKLKSKPEPLYLNVIRFGGVMLCALALYIIFFLR